MNTEDSCFSTFLHKEDVYIEWCIKYSNVLLLLIFKHNHDHLTDMVKEKIKVEMLCVDKAFLNFKLIVFL